MPCASMSQLRRALGDEGRGELGDLGLLVARQFACALENLPQLAERTRATRPRLGRANQLGGKVEGGSLPPFAPRIIVCPA